MKELITIDRIRAKLREEYLKDLPDEKKIRKLNRLLFQLKQNNPVELATVQQILDEAKTKITQENPIRVRVHF